MGAEALRDVHAGFKTVPSGRGSSPPSDEELVQLLTTGIWKNGNHLRPPMPQFRMSREDAEAVVYYLRSLTPHAGD